MLRLAHVRIAAAPQAPLTWRLEISKIAKDNDDPAISLTDSQQIDFFASHPHFFDHIVPIWHALPERRRGNFFVHGRLIDHALDSGVMPFRRGAAKSGDGLAHDFRTSDVALVSGRSDIKKARKAGWRDIVYACHGVGQDYGQLRRYDGHFSRSPVRLFLVPNQMAAYGKRIRHPDAAVAVVGCPKLDPWHARQEELYARQHKGRPVVAISFRWNQKLEPESRGAFEHYAAALPRLARHFTVLGHGHPMLIKRLARFYKRLGITVVHDFATVLDEADVYVVDNSSTMYEFASTGRPVVVLNAPWYRRSMRYGLRFWRYANVGVNCNRPGQLVPSVYQALQDPPEVRWAREAAIRDVYAVYDGTATERACAAIVDLLASPVAPTLA